MELDHRFELPVGVAAAWASLTDIETMGPCFPGATVDEVEADGTSFSGSVKVKLGHAPWTYRGRGTLTEQDAVAHRVRLEASGTAARGASTAALLVTITATAISESRTSVDLLTTLSITGRPADFGRAVMVEKANDLVSQFADNLSEELTGRPTGGAELMDSVDPDQVTAAIVSQTAEDEVVGSVELDRDAADHLAAHRYADGGTAAEQSRPAGLPVLRRVVPIVLAVSAALLLRKLFSGKDDDSDSGADDSDAQRGSSDADAERDTDFEADDEQD